MEQLIIEDLKATLPLEITPAFPPYSTELDLQKKILATYRMLLRSTRLRDRIFTLTNAYYLGKLLETETTTPSQRSQLRGLLTKYYSHVSIRTYYLFEILGVDQIQRTKNMTLKDIYRLSSKSYRYIVDEATNIWAGAQNLEGED
jgi:hypothetical protein